MALVPHVKNVIQKKSFGFDRTGIRTRGNEKPVKRDFFFPRVFADNHPSVIHIDVADALSQNRLHIELFVKVLSPDRQLFRGYGSFEYQADHGPAIGSVGFISDNGDASLPVELPDGLGCHDPGDAVADDDIFHGTSLGFGSNDRNL